MLITLIFALSSFAADSYGKGVTIKEAPVSLTEAIKNLKSNDGKEIVVKAKVEKVCQSKGCWLVLKDGESQVRVTFANYSFFVPKNSAESEAVVQGKLFEKEISAAEARHYAKDEHKPAKEVAKIQASQKAPWFEATGLTLSKK
jgi:cytochrome c-type biogenesis protein CcmE